MTGARTLTCLIVPQKLECVRESVLTPFNAEENSHVKEHFDDQDLEDLNKKRLITAEMITSLCRAIVNGHPFRNDKKDSDDKKDLSNTDDTEPKLLILLDEYDAPVRDSFLPLVDSNSNSITVRPAYSSNFKQYENLKLVQGNHRP